MQTSELSSVIFQKLCEVIPGGVNSPMRAFTGMGQPPMVVESGKGDQIIDADGNAFIDYCGSWGALIHGHAHPGILEAVARRMSKGTSFGITTEIEQRMASKIVEHMPSIKKIRFVNSGTEATMTAVRLARGFTGRKIILKFDGNYHGHADLFLVKAGSGVTNLTAASSSAGIPEEVVQHVASLPYNDVQAAKNYLRTHSIAAVILEPVAGNMGVVPAKREFAEMLREETANQGALLIFDEVMTGFRVALGGAQSLYGIAPDLTCLGKVIGGGFPVAGIGGKEEVMNCLAPLGPVYQAGTLSGNPVAMEAGYQAISRLETEAFFLELERKTRMIVEPVEDFIKTRRLNACIQSCGSMLTLFFGRRSIENQNEAKACDLNQFAAFFRYMYSQGVYIPPCQFEAWFVSQAHTEEHLIQTRNLVLQFLEEV